eukprot:scaffold88200_cov40-Phaeocystis_antarctica.AAC.1
MPTLELQALLVSWEAQPQGQSAPLARRAWRLWAARHSQEEAGPLGVTGRPATAAGARASRHQSRRCRAFDHPGAADAGAGRGAAGGP